MQTYKTENLVRAMQWRPDDPEARQAFLDELHEMSEVAVKYRRYEISAEIQETARCDMWHCLHFHECCRSPAGRIWIRYDLTEKVMLDPGDWLIHNWGLEDWLYAESDEDFQAAYVLCSSDEGEET